MKTTLERKEIVKTASMRIELESQDEINAFESVLRMAEMEMHHRHPYLNARDLEWTVIDSLRKALTLKPENR